MAKYNKPKKNNEMDVGCPIRLSFNSSKNGFTLLEVLIALVILGIALIPLLVSQARTAGDYIKVNNMFYETRLARNLLSNVFLTKDIYITNKQEKITGVKNYMYKKAISKTSFPGIYLINITVFKKGGSPKSGVTLKVLAQE
jgi:prepilin-type N-terminal cleavage/methylation domain-containing protein